MSRPGGCGPTLQQRWTELDNARTVHKSRWEEYSGWTLPYVFPPTGSADVELQGPTDSIGARVVNHLANKVAQVLFLPQAPFFRIRPTRKARTALAQRMAENNASEDDYKSAISDMEKAFSNAEKEAVYVLERAGYRPAAVQAAKNLIISGNAMIAFEKDKAARSYTLRDFVVVRNMSGDVQELIFKDCRKLDQFSPEVQAIVKRDSQGRNKKDVTLYTQAKLVGEKYKVEQAADDIKLDTSAIYAKDDLPWTVVSWNLVQGEHYGRGLVEDYAGAFHSIQVLTKALVLGAAIAADIKYLVKPSSVLNVEELNRAATGSFHTGEPEDIRALQLDKALDFQMAQTLLERFEREIAQAFVMTIGTTRDAERVTAVEIRRDAMDLEQSLGGVYSHLALEWQKPVAGLLLRRIDMNEQDLFETTIVTGMDTLSRFGDLDNIQSFLSDLAMTQNLPEPVLNVLDLHSFMQVIGTARGVDYGQFMKSRERAAADQQQEMQQQQALMQQQQQGQLAIEAGKAAMKE